LNQDLSDDEVASAPTDAVAVHAVLVVDDDRDVRAAVGDILEAAGYAVTSVANANLALSHLCQNPPPAVVLSDLLMPGMNAWELVGQMRRRSALTHVPVIVMTGSPQYGAPVPKEMVLTKPIDAAHLLDLVGRTIAGAKSAAGAAAISGTERPSG
jgi:CheY-like chemotaxis protein